jgi:hypothetical protein
MKKFLLGTPILIAGLFTLALSASAQTGTVVVTIPHAFKAGGERFPAGTYRVSPDSTPSGPRLVLRGEGRSVFLVPGTQDDAIPGMIHAELTRTGGEYYLSEIATDLGIFKFVTPWDLPRAGKTKSQGGDVARGQ